MPEMTLEQLYQQMEKLGKVANKMELFMASQDDPIKVAAIKKADDEKKDEEKKEAKKAAKSAALKQAMEEKDEEKRDAAIRLAMEDDDKKEAFGKPKKAMSDEEKERDAQVAAIINEKKNTLINQILSANRIINPTGIQAVEARLKTASITDIQKEYDIIKPFVAGTAQTVHTQQIPIPFYASFTPADIDSKTLSASSPIGDFAKLSTKELLEGGQ